MSNGDATLWGRIRDLGRPEDRRAWNEAWAYLHTRYRGAMIACARGVIQRMGGGVVVPDEAEDVVQRFLEQCLEKGWLLRADPARGRFRTFVRVLLERFTRDHVESRRRWKNAPRGGPPVSHDDVGEPAAADAAVDLAFQEEWARCLCQAAIARVAARSRPNATVIEDLLRHGDSDPSRIALLLGVERDAVPLRVFKARKMFAEEVWEELKQTVTDPRDREDERLALVRFLGRYVGPDGAPSLHGLAPPPES